MPAKIINITNLSLTGIASSNYTVNLPANNITLTGASDGITKKPLTVSAAHTKGYDGNTSADGVVITLGGIISGDTVSSGTFTAVYTNSNVGAQNITITNLQLTGASAGNYSVPASVNVSVAGITKKALTVDGASHTKVYDGTTAANGISITLGGVLPGDNITATPGSATAYTSADAGTKTIYISSVGISGSGINNYTEPVGEITVTVSGGITKANYPSNYITFRNYVAGAYNSPNDPYIGGTAKTMFFEKTLGENNNDFGRQTLGDNLNLQGPQYLFTLAEGGYPDITVLSTDFHGAQNIYNVLPFWLRNTTTGVARDGTAMTIKWEKLTFTFNINESRNYFATNNVVLTRYFIKCNVPTGSSTGWGNLNVFDNPYKPE